MTRREVISEESSSRFDHTPTRARTKLTRKELSVIMEEEQRKNRYLLGSQNGFMNYHISLIDYLQEWNLNKKMERYAKIFLRNADPNGLSAIEPVAY